MKFPNVIIADELKDWSCEAQIDEKYVLARPINGFGGFFRLKLAWSVFSGKNDVLNWI
jgi:hypothetical protein